MNINNWKNRIFKGSSFNSWFYADSLQESRDAGESYSNACFNIDETTVIAIGCDPLSPKEFIQNNQHNSFKIDFSIPPKSKGDSTIYFAKEAEDDINQVTEKKNTLTQFKVLELWPETMGKTGIHCLLGMLAVIKNENFGLSNEFSSFDHTGSLFIIPHDNDMAFYLRNAPDDIKQLDLDDFIEGSVNMKGQSIKSYYYKDYLIEAAKLKNEYFSYFNEVSQSNTLSKFEINLKKISYEISGRPKNGNYSMAELDSYFMEINRFLKEILINETAKFRQRRNGMLSLTVVFQDEPPKFILTNVSSFGFALEEIQEAINKIRDQIL